jgi:phosphoribosylformylglycinamidine (FGAM) synthase-like amidotransferase family enzyme
MILLFFSDEVEEEIMVFFTDNFWDNGIQFFHLLDLIMEKQLQNLMVISIKSNHDGKYINRCKPMEIQERSMVFNMNVH